MERIDLNGKWTLHTPEGGLEATVPGSVYTALLAAGRMEDPYWRDNELKALPLMEHEYTYTRSFWLDAVPENPVLVCEGLDTLAEVRVNGRPAGRADNMHRCWRFSLRGLLQAGENELRITFASPTRYIREAYEQVRTHGSSECMRGFAHLRKAHYMFGWDWGACLPDAGIWKDIYIESAPARLAGVYVEQRHQNSAVELALRPEVDACVAGEYTCRATLTAPDGTVAPVDGLRHTVAAPQLWWPNGYGAQPLYTLCVTLEEGGRELDRWQRRIGLRSLQVKREKDEHGEGFAFCVNGVDIFAMGADYIPEDHLLPRMTPQRTRALLEDCALANMNCVRVWGGGFYPFDWFYDACDELGLLVWQDLMFACTVYELTDDFAASITAELEDNVRRLRHHASLGLWCGNNEMEWQMGDPWECSPKQYGDYFRMYETLFPALLKRLDPATFYWPASPSSGGCFDEPNSYNRGDTHYWEVWHGERPFSDYRTHHFRFASEFGFQSLPAVKTIESFTLPEDRNLFSYVMEKHQRHNAANGRIMKYLSQNYLYPQSFDALVYASQLLQAEAIRYGVEHWRRNRGRCMGAVYWQLNDCWPVASWASIDYFGRWKALHYYAKRFFAPVLLSACEEGLATQGGNINDEDLLKLEKSVVLSVANETREDFEGAVAWQLRGARGGVLREGVFEAEVPALSSLWLPKLDFADADLRAHYVAYALSQNGERVSSGTVLFCPPKYFRFEDPRLEVWAEGDAVAVRAAAFAKNVEVSAAGDVLLEDNYFDMNAGETRRVRVLRGEAKGLSARSVYDIR